MATPPAIPDLAMGAPDLATPPNNCTVSSLIINEVQTGPGTDEFIEIWNPCANALTLSGKIVYRAASSSSDNSTFVTISNKSIAAMGYLLIANSGFSGTATPDFTYSGGMADGGGGIALRDGGGAILCSMAWGTGSNGFENGTAAPTEGTGQSIARKPSGANTHNDSVDFKSSTPTPGAAN